MTRGPRRSASALSLGAWTLLVWGGRLRNIARDGTLGGAERIVAIVTAVVFVVVGLGFLVVGLGRLGRGAVSSARSSRRRRVEVVVAGGVGLYWAVRAAMIASAGHSVGFVAVHSVLAAVSIGLAMWVIVDHGRERTIRITEMRARV